MAHDAMTLSFSQDGCEPILPATHDAFLRLSFPLFIIEQKSALLKNTEHWKMLPLEYYAETFASFSDVTVCYNNNSYQGNQSNIQALLLQAPAS